MVCVDTIQRNCFPYTVIFSDNFCLVNLKEFYGVCALILLSYYST